MMKLHDGQCGLCTHFGEEHPTNAKLVQIRTSKETSGDLIETCGLPKNKQVHLKVTPLSGCEGFERVRS